MTSLWPVVRRGSCEIIMWTTLLFVAVFANTSARQLDYEDAYQTGQNSRELYLIRKIKHFFDSRTNQALVGGIASGAMLLLLLVMAIAVFCFCYICRLCCFKRRGFAAERKQLIGRFHPPEARYSSTEPQGVAVRPQSYRRERTVAEELNRQKQDQEQLDRDNAKYVVEFYLRNNATFKMVNYLPDMGSRVLKFWFIIEDRLGQQQLLTIGPVSQKCSLSLDPSSLKTLNKMLSMLSHPHLYNVNNISYVSERNQVIIIQSINKAGSLKDCIYKSSFATEWTLKYSRRSRGLSSHDVALYGRQILEGLRYLYNQGFPPLGHVQTGNIFVDGDICRLGGYENTLLGYKTRSYKLCKGHMEDIDLILFGHAIFEMSCGYEMTALVPGEVESRSVRSSQVKTVLQVIFDQDEDGNFTSTIDKVYKLPFFQDVILPVQEGARSDHTYFPSDVRNMLAKVSKDKPRAQRISNRRKKKRPSHGSVAALPSATPIPSTSTALDSSTPATSTSTRGHTSVGVAKFKGGLGHTKPSSSFSSSAFSHPDPEEKSKYKATPHGSKSKLQNSITEDSNLSRV